MRLPAHSALLPLGLALAAAPGLARGNTLAPDALEEEAPDGAERVWNEEVVGGQPVSPGQWPDTAGVFFGGELGCTGTLIAPNLVLTAGHCIADDIDRVLLNSTDASAGGEEIAVAQTVAYPNWEQTYDVGLLILAGESTVKPRTIAGGCVIDQYYAQGAAVELVGYGATDVQGTVYGTQLLRGAATIIDPDCQPGDGCNAQVSPGGELIAGGNGVDSCFGDSGGPVYLRTEAGDFLVGVTSRGLYSSATPCGGGGIYTRPDAVTDWIEQQTGVTLPTPSCETGVEEPGSEAGEPGSEPGEPGGEPEDPTGSETPGGDDPQTGGVSNQPISGGCSVGASGSSSGLFLLGLALVALFRRQRD